MRARKTANRAQRVCDQIQRDLAELIPREVRDPRVGLVTISGVEITPDYAHAKVYFTVIGSEPAQAQAGLDAAQGHLHYLLFKRLSIHTVPKLHFVHDTSLERGFEMDGLIAQAMASTPPTPDGSAPETGNPETKSQA